MAGTGKSKRHIPFCPFSDSTRRSQCHSFSKGLLTCVWALGDLLGWSWFSWPLALKVKSEVTEDREWKGVSEKQWAKCSWRSRHGTSGDTWFSPQMGIRGVLWKKWLNEAENSRIWPKRWSRGGIFKINLKFKMYCTTGVRCVVNGFPAHLENHWWRPHFKWLYIQRCLKQYFCFLFWILLLYFIIFPSTPGSVIFCWAPLHHTSVLCDSTS